MNYNFEVATIKDIFFITEIVKSHYLNLGKDGFFMTSPPENFFADKLNNAENKLYVAKTEDGEVVGFISLSTNFSNVPFEKYAFNEPKQKDDILSKTHLYIEQIGIKKEYRSQGIGKFLYKNLFETEKETIFTANVITEPVKNEASVNLHLSVGFEAVAYHNDNENFGLENYEGTLFMKTIKNAIVV